MTHRRQKNTVPHSAGRMFDLVADVESYPEFVPYCTGLRVLKRWEKGDVEHILAEMLVQYKVFRERFKCEVRLDRNKQLITVTYVEGPIKKLENIWRFQDLDENHSEIDFEIDFEFKNLLLQSVSNAVFDKAFTYMSDAFIQRADSVYAPLSSSTTA